MYFLLYISILISIKLGLHLQKRLKEAGRDSETILSDKYCLLGEWSGGAFVSVTCITALVTTRHRAPSKV